MKILQNMLTYVINWSEAFKKKFNQLLLLQLQGRRLPDLDSGVEENGDMSEPQAGVI